ncbi:MAG: NmrA family NAD(P)-binding protein, partial [Actinobacteria bacterium]|nr:NmrA family NAD(P)-binding protein [Actinomycetota bacterium]
MALTVLVTGASGRLGGVAPLLLAGGHRVRALTREPDSAAGLELRRLGASVVRGDFDDLQSLVAAAEGVDAIFATGTAHKAGPEGEVRHGMNVAEAAKAAGVGHFVYSSAAGADRGTGVPVFESKGQVERQIRSLGLPYTIIAPVYFMENLFNPWNLPA